MNMKKKVTVLSIDGGGIRGILPGVILAHIENKLRELEGDHVRLSDYFDLIAGTSTGGILSLIYLAPGPDGRPKFTAQDAVDLYLKNGSDIFNLEFWQKIRSGWNITDEKYNAAKLQENLLTYLGDTKLSQLLKPCLITSYDIFQRKAILFNKMDAVKNNIRDFYARDIGRATSAAPTYFEVAEVRSLNGAPFYLIDGGVYANNPALCAYAEARKINFKTELGLSEKADKPMAKEMMILSLGTGSSDKPFLYDSAKNWGAVGWILPLIDILMSGNTETVSYQLNQIFKTIPSESNRDYYRLDPPRGQADTKMDNASRENMKALEESGKLFVINNCDLLDKIVRKLIENK
jgi:uncharacterized protein